VRLKTSYEDLKRNRKSLEYYFNYVYSSLSASFDEVKMGLEKDVGCQDFLVDIVSTLVVQVIALWPPEIVMYRNNLCYNRKPITEKIYF
jgi:hypothetical protein